ncbi:G-protein coupled receptor Mth-like 1, partial [Asbolus verrucosus]
MATRTALFLLICVVCSVATVKNVTISKCCKKTETLSNENKCVSTSSFDWTLHIYNPANGRLLTPQNKIPPNWHLKEDSKPRCLRPALLTPTLSSYIPFLNGSVYVLGYDELVHSDSFCIDYKAVLICLREQPQSMSSVRVKKCCGKDAIFSNTNNTCIHFKDNSYKIDIGPGKTWAAGFPNCNHQEIVLTGKLHDAEMQNNGSLLLRETKTLLPAGNYCLEHVLENAGRSASIMVCQEHLPSVKVEHTKTNDLRFTIYPIALALSAVFLAATLAASAILPASHHVLHWRCQIHHVICLLVGNVLLCITQLMGKMDPTPCSLM